MTYILQQALNALQLGSIYALIALGYTMVYGILSMINFAHGDVFMVGAFLCFLAASFLDFGFLPSLLASMTGAALLGVIIERVAYRPLRNAPRVSAVITALGVGILLENLTRAISPYSQNIPPLIDNRTFTVAGVSLSSVQALIIVLSFALMAVLDFVVHRTKLGMAMRAISWDKSTALLMGVPSNLIVSSTFAIGAALAGAAGTMYGLAYPVIDPYMGIMVGWKAFISAVIGGIGNIRGAMIGAFILATVEIAVPMVMPSTCRDFVAFSLLFGLLLARPHGILGRPRTQKV